MADRHPENTHTDEISLAELWAILRDGWKLLVGMTVLGIVLAITAAFLMTPVYRAQAVISEVETGSGGASGASALLGQFGGLANLAGVNLRGVGGARNDGRTIIQSRTFLERFIDERDLMPLVYADRWNEETQQWNADVKRAPALWQGANKFADEVFSLSEDNETGLLTVAVEWPDAELAANWTNGIVKLANEMARERDIAESEKSISYLNEQLEQTNVVELQRVLYNLVEVEQQTLMLANAKEEYAFRVVDPAVVPVSVARPKPLFMTVLGAFLGGFFGFVAVVFSKIVSGLRDSEPSPADA